MKAKIGSRTTIENGDGGIRTKCKLNIGPTMHWAAVWSLLNVEAGVRSLVTFTGDLYVPA